MTYDPTIDQRLDPRIKTLLSLMPSMAIPSYATYEEMVAAARAPEALLAAERRRSFMTVCNTNEIAPSDGLRESHETLVSDPDGNTIALQIFRPDSDEQLPCVYYIHGGAMSALSSYDGNYVAWGKILAAQGVCVVLVEFRNSVEANALTEVAPFPAGLNDCVSGLKWVHEHAEHLNINPSRIVVAGESGGGNLTLATGLRLKREGSLGLVAGLYAFCPYIAGSWPQPELPSSTENNGILLDLHGSAPAMAYGQAAFDDKNAEAWPLFATARDLEGFPPVVISVNECDPLRDEGIAFYRRLLSAGVPARARTVLGTMHGTELFPILCPEITADAAAHLAAFARG
jgi:acetyl esterase/lipase